MSFMSMIVLLFLLFLKCRQGLAKHGTEYGPLQEIPDWSYAGQCAQVCTDILPVYTFLYFISRICHQRTSILASLPKCLLSQIQRVPNASDRQRLRILYRTFKALYKCCIIIIIIIIIVLGLQPHDHIRPALFELHWLPDHLSIEYKQCLLMHFTTIQCCPSYICDLVQTIPPHHLVIKDYVCPLTLLHIQFHRPLPCSGSGH